MTARVNSSEPRERRNASSGEIDCFVQGMGGVGTLSDGGYDQDVSGATYVATNGTMTGDKPSAVITGMDGLYRADYDQLDADMMKLA